jgi:hypothetical protein
VAFPFFRQEVKGLVGVHSLVNLATFSKSINIGKKVKAMAVYSEKYIS